MVDGKRLHGKRRNDTRELRRYSKATIWHLSNIFVLNASG